MVDLSSIATAVSVLRNGREILRELKERSLAKEQIKLVDSAMEVVADASDRLFAIQTALLELREENAALKEKIRSYEDWKERKSAYRMEKTSAGGVVLVSSKPFPHYACHACAETRRELHVLQDHGPYAGSAGCPNCGKNYQISEPRDLPQPGSDWDPFDVP